MFCLRRVKADSTHWESWALLVCAGPCFELFTAVVASALLFAVVCWECGSSGRDRKKTKQAGQAGQLYDGPFPGLHWGGRWEEDVGQADIHHGQPLSPPAPHCGGFKQLFQQHTAASSVGVNASADLSSHQPWGFSTATADTTPFLSVQYKMCNMFITRT